MSIIISIYGLSFYQTLFQKSDKSKSLVERTKRYYFLLGKSVQIWTFNLKNKMIIALIYLKYSMLILSKECNKSC